MAGLLYTHPNDDYVDALVRSGAVANITFGGTADAAYPVENIGDQDPSNPFKTPDLSADIDIDLGAAVPIGVIAIIHANLTPGLSPSVPSILLDDNAGFTSPETFVVDVPDYAEDGHPTNSLYDFVAEGDGVKTFRYVRIRITGNAVPVTIGEVCVYPGWRELPVDFRPSAEDDEDHPGIKNASEGGGVTTKYTHEYRMRWLRGDMLDTNEGDDELIRRWSRAASGDVRPFLIHPHLPILEPWYVSFEKSRLPRKRLFREEETGRIIHGYTVGFEEQARGLPPEPVQV